MERSKDISKHHQMVEVVFLRLFALLLNCGAREKDLRRLVEMSLDAASNDFHFESISSDLDIHKLGEMLRTWHRETCYLTNDGVARRLALGGKFGLQSLISRHYPKEKFAAVFDQLKRTKLIKRDRRGRWFPTEPHARIPMHSQEIVVHLAEGIYRLIETVNRNMNSEDDAEVLFERASKVKHLPFKHAKTFKSFVRQQATAFITTVDDWLEARVERNARSRINTCVAGAHAFAFMDDAPFKVARRRLRAKKRRD